MHISYDVLRTISSPQIIHIYIYICITADYHIVMFIFKYRLLYNLEYLNYSTVIVINQADVTQYATSKLETSRCLGWGKPV